MNSPVTEHTAISLKIAELEEQVKQSLPGMATMLRDIHRILLSDPALVTVLSDEEIRVIVNGLSKQTNTTIQESITGKGKGKSMKQMSVDDI